MNMEKVEKVTGYKYQGIIYPTKEAAYLDVLASLSWVEGGGLSYAQSLYVAKNMAKIIVAKQDLYFKALEEMKEPE